MKTKLVTSYEDVRNNVECFNRELVTEVRARTGRRLAERLAFTRAWYFVPEIDAVGPSKFIGYQGMTAERYDPDAYELDGRQTEPILRQWFQPLEPGTPEEAQVRAKVVALLAKHGKRPSKAVRFCAPIGWQAAGKKTQPRVTPTGAGRRTIHATITRGESLFVAECDHLAVVTQGRTVDETIANLKEAIEVHLEGEDLATFGLAPEPVVLVTLEFMPWAA